MKEWMPIMWDVMFYSGPPLIINVTYLVMVLAGADQATSRAHSKNIHCVRTTE